MKQRITPDQLNELTPDQQNRLREWWTPQEYDIALHNGSCTSSVSATGFDNRIWCGGANIGTKAEVLPLLSIGQCIELLLAKNQTISVTKLTKNDTWGIGYFEEYAPCYECAESFGSHLDGIDDELIDALWQAVKAVL